MIDNWRTLLYPLGFLSAFAFGGRFIIQWLKSEKAHRSVVPRSFWQLSLVGNLLLIIHSFIQIQYHVCIVQVCNAIISWRNLDLMQAKPNFSFKEVCYLFITSVCVISLAFVAQSWWLMSDDHWFRVPIAPWQTTFISPVSFFWHMMGTLAYLLFSSRFWIQWWCSEKKQSSDFPYSFWLLSLIGALLSIAYFLRIHDTVNLIGPLVGIIPYIRNLMLSSKKRVEI